MGKKTVKIYSLKGFISFMDNFLNKLERQFGRYAIPDLIRYVIILYCAGAVIGMINENIYYEYLCLDMSAVFRGQIWRLVTFLIEPYGFSSGMGMLLSILFFVIQVQLFFLFGRSLEQAWGTFKFNMYFLSGYLFNIIAALILYFIIPIKVKWLAILDAAYMLYQVVQSFYYGILLYSKGASGSGAAYISMGIAIIVAMANFLIFFFSTRNYRRVSPKDIHRRRTFKKQTQTSTSGPRHRCAICGRTELDDENLDFRFCSKCDGNYEYCSDHLFTHQHVKKFM